jgi:hypothetical protein
MIQGSLESREVLMVGLLFYLFRLMKELEFLIGLLGDVKALGLCSDWIA